MAQNLADSLALTPGLLLAVLIGVVLGLAAGLLPGVSTVSALLVVAPISIPLAVAPGVGLLVGAYAGARAGASVTAILYGMPGETAALPAAAAGHAMTRAGHGAAALWAAGLGALLATAAAALVVPQAVPPVKAMMAALGPPELTMLLVAALAMAAGLLGRSLTRGTASLALGLAAGLQSAETQPATSFFTLGLAGPSGGVQAGVLLVGLLAVGEVLHQTARPWPDPVAPQRGPLLPARTDLLRSWRPWLRGTAIGLPLGLFPPGAADVAARLAAAVERRRARRREGTAPIAVVAGAEAAAAAAGAGMLALLFTALAVAAGGPAVGTTASASLPVLGEALAGLGMRTGLGVFEPGAAGAVPALLAILLAGTVIAFALVLPASGLLARAARTSPELGYPVVLAVAVAAVVLPYLPVFWTANPVTLVVFGAAGLLMRRAAVPLAPAVIGFLLEPVTAGHLEQSIAQGEARGIGLAIFAATPLSALFLALAVAALLGPVAYRLVRAGRAPPTPPPS